MKYIIQIIAMFLFLLGVVTLLITLPGCECDISEQECLNELNARQQEWTVCMNELQEYKTILHAQGFGDEQGMME